MTRFILFNDRPLILGHRGARGLAAENTLHAVRLAAKAGADGCEIDVSPTKDGELIVLHDLNLLRTTNAAGQPLFANNPPALPWRFTLEEIRTLSANIYPRRLCGANARTAPGRNHQTRCIRTTACPRSRKCWSSSRSWICC